MGKSILLAPLVGWASAMQRLIEFQNDQIETLMKLLGKKRVLLTDDQHRVLAAKGHGTPHRSNSELTQTLNF